MNFWNFDNLERITGGTWRVPPAADAPTPSGLWHDSRDLQPGQIYLAVKGDTHDGHRFVEDAFARGAALAIVSDDSPLDRDDDEDGESFAAASHRPVLRVEDTVAALQDLASACRDDLAAGGCKVIAVCGSNGKTTTRHLIHHVLTACGLRGSQSPKSFNNHLGVPLTLLAANPTDDFVACELGTNHPGEIAALGEIVWPDAVVLTSVGREHLEFFGDVAGVAKEEAAIFPFVRPQGLIALPAAAAALTAAYYDVQDGVALLPVRDAADVPAMPHLPGEHNRLNAALVLRLVRWLGRDLPLAQQALSTATPPPGRLSVRKFGQGVTLLDDTYNANPDSMLAALRTLASEGISRGRRVAVLGAMGELGAASAAGHAEVSAAARELADEVILIGEAFGAGPWTESTPDDVAAAVRPGDTVLLKASRAMRLERIIPAIAARFPPPAAAP